MKIITTLADIQALAETASLPAPVLQLLRSELELLAQAYECHKVADLDLTADGPLVWLERGDDLRDLSPLGLNPADNGLLGSAPEVVQALTLSDGTIACRVVLLLNSEYALTLFLCPRHFDPEVEQWLAAEIKLSASGRPLSEPSN